MFLKLSYRQKFVLSLYKKGLKNLGKKKQKFPGFRVLQKAYVYIKQLQLKLNSYGVE